MGSELSDVALVVAGAVAGGMAFHSLRQPAFVGYILAGVILGPSALGLVADRHDIRLLAELGVLLLLFLVGLELSLRAFRRVWRVALTTMALQLAAALGVALVARQVLDWPLALTVVVGCSLALSSTAVAMKILDDIGELRSDTGRVAVGVLIAQDLAVVPMLLIIASLGGEGGGFITALINAAIAVAVLAAIIGGLSGRRKINLPFARQRASSVELTALGALALCLAAAVVSSLLGLSAAYGAFIAGLVLGNSAERRRMIEVTRPVEAILMMVFFLSVGLLLDLGFIWRNLGIVLVLVLTVTLAKTALNITILRLQGEPWQRAFLAGTVMGQVGEFSFVLAATAFGRGLIGADANRLVVAVIALSLALSPLWLITARRLEEIRWRAVNEPRAVLVQLYGHEAGLVLAAAGRLWRFAAWVLFSVWKSLSPYLRRLRSRNRPPR
ncbi:MAG TPA: cation:proton antiporter [Alphaproteobacteria bacterium]|jgi:CPA2 family monovalent cation:H+ antiporter-2|nr:cation:proton antiporter [Alphaproteobacteria bacterium]